MASIGAAVDRLRGLLGPAGWLEDDAATAPYRTDWLKRFRATPLGVARPASTAEVAAVVTACADAGIAVTPQGGNTGLVGGGVPTGEGPSIVLGLGRMRRILKIDPVDFTASVEAGVVLAGLREAAAAEGLLFPLSLGAEGSAQIGGLIATNAGGSHVLRYGMMGDLVLGVEAVLPDGRVWDGNRALLKDNAGYQLRRLFCGAEGTLGVVTRATLRLFPAPRRTATALLGLASLGDAVGVGAMLRKQAGEFVGALEFFGEAGLALARKHVAGLADPLEAPAPVYLLAELTASAEGIDLDAVLEAALAAAFEAGLVQDGSVAASGAQRAAFWRLREEMPEGQRLEGPQLKHDVAVPVSRLADFVARADAAVAGVLPAVRVNAFGHLGDGNVHYNLSPPEGLDFAGREAALADAVHETVVALEGTVSAEHGLGQAKVTLADRLRPAVERDLMRRLKTALDPEGIMNPGKVV
ncbi:MAG: FAD-binding oxidoreductase [Geminicoccaceae bacterium]|nr:FAD-binding oxidoreductase [Geminicoccaceae bacterium]